MVNTNHITFRQNATKAEALLKQLANANRLQVLCALSTGEKTVGEIQQSVDLSQSALSQHLARLRAAGLVDCQRSGQHQRYRITSPQAQAVLTILHALYCP